MRVLCGLVALLCVSADPQYQRRDSESLKQKVAGISEFAEQTSATSRRTTITENEVNAYLAYDGKAQLPAGVVDPVVSIVGTERVSARAVVDLDGVRKQRNPRSAFDPTSYLSGRLPVAVSGLLKTSNGTGRFELESATIGGVRVPKMVLQEIVSVYSRTPDDPSGINLDTPFALPAKIREIQVQPRQAVIVQ
jgi:hypothetical protein